MRIESGPLTPSQLALDPTPALPEEWDTWAEEPAHQVVVEEAGAPVGALHVALVSVTEAWLEGLRVRRDRQGAGIGGRLVAEGEALARRYGAAVVRTAIPAHDYAAQQVAERAGFQTVARAVVHETPIPEGPIDVPYDALVAEAEARDVAPLTSWLRTAETLIAWGGLLPLGWRFRAFRPELVKGLVRDRRVLRAGETVEGAALFKVHGDAAVVAVLEGSRPQRQALAGAVALRARGQGASRLAFFAPDEEALRTIRERRPHRWCPDGLSIVEKALA
ncbi:MAG TPA: GNAT family N-acetyltransferase [bacterium]|jgi:GNAT superfamily N-acetyltransferase|nr:GNAT family N-acetyltransferase [bacterium]